MSRLRGYLPFGVTTGGYAVYQLDSSRVDYELARQLYENNRDEYKLGAGFARGIINTLVAFMGVPRFLSEDENAQKVLDEFFGANRSRVQRTHRNALRDGDCFVWITREETDKEFYPELNTKLVYHIIPPEQVDEIKQNPVTGDVYEYVLKSRHKWTDEHGSKRQATVTQRITRETRTIEIDGGQVPGVRPGTEENIWGFIPIVHFRNEGDETAVFGRSELEPVEPFLKLYHDVMLHAAQGSKMHSTPRLKLKLKDVAAFLRNNFNITEPAEFAKKGGTINLSGHELLIFSSEEDAGFLEAQSATGDTIALLKLIFYCIVDTSETPEFVFGVHTPSSMSSVKEQMPVVVRKVIRKRDQFADPWQLVARIVLAMTAKSEGKAYSTYATELDWDEVDPRDEKEVAEILEKVASALDRAVQGGFLSDDAAAEFLSRYVDTMRSYESEAGDEPGERERIIRNRIERARLEDAEGLLDEKSEIDKELGGKQ
jgi:hypothetical protein